MATSKTGNGAQGEGGAPRKATKKAPGTGAAGAAKKATGGGSAAKRAAANVTAGKRSASRSPDLRKDLRDFASGRPQGWNHEDWQAFLEHLRGRGHDTSNSDAIGLALERERLALSLEKIEGVGPQRVKSLADRFTTIWSLRNADVEEIAAAANIRRDLAERIKSSV